MSHEKFISCIRLCTDCTAQCKHCLNACLDEEDVKRLGNCIRLDADCAAVCFLAVELMASGSQFSGRVCALCADICEACAAECDKHGHYHCVKCAEMCRMCAVECRQMAA